MIHQKTLAVLGLVSALQMFGESKTAFLSTCFSNICVGDDIERVMEAEPKWVTKHIKANDEGKSVVHLREVSQLRKKYSAVIGATYHNLSDTDLDRLAENFLDGYSGEPTSYKRLMEPLTRERVAYLAADATALQMLSKASICGFLPIHGVFSSESGLYTSVLLVPVNGKLTVVQLQRIFDLHIPDDLTGAQKGKLTFEQVTAFVKQIDAKYGTQWDTSAKGSIPGKNRASGEGVVAYLTLDEIPMGNQKWLLQPVMTLTNESYESTSWQNLKPAVDESLASTRACGVNTRSVAIE
jgi:hypothetical protein